MGSFPYVLLIYYVSTIASSNFIYPNFTSSNGTILFSLDNTFKASMINPIADQPTNFYLCVIHVGSNTITWSANRNKPVSKFGITSLTRDGVSITDQNGVVIWSTPQLNATVSALELTENGNLILLDQFYASLWESFNYPTDTIVIGQKLPIGGFLSSDYMAVGKYSLVLSASDALLQWENTTYWELSMEKKSYINSNYPVEHMAINQTGLYLYGQNGSEVIIGVILSPANFRFAKLDSFGQFSVSSYNGSSLIQELEVPLDMCRIPLVCGRLGLCSDDTSLDDPVCSCPPNFSSILQNTTDCVPSDKSYTLSNLCNSINNNSNTINSSLISYLELGYGIDYFASDYAVSARYSVNVSSCQDICSQDCSCPGIFYVNSSGLCYVLLKEVGSFMLSTNGNNDRLVFIKVLVGSLPSNKTGTNHATKFPVVALVLLPFSGLLLFLTLGFLLWRKTMFSMVWNINSSNETIPPLEDLEDYLIPGLPTRFNYTELEVATNNFEDQIGSGGFGAVYKGILPDNSLVAVKKISNLGIQRKDDFYTEIAIVGNIHHINLVKLRGFCSQGRERLLVYEYMNRGSLDKTLFGDGYVLEWKERVEIALGTARGLAYLHSGCQQIIIHCDIKPENILLHDHFQAKISDFGLSKLHSPEQSSMSTTVRGTRGYLAPEWLTNSTITEKSDVYSFGMVLLEIASGRKNCSVQTQSHDINNAAGGSHSSSSPGLAYFPFFALEMHEQGRYLELADRRLEGRVSSDEVAKLVCVALCCLQEEPGLRPPMALVVGMLEGEVPVVKPRIESLKFLRSYGQRFAEASTIEGNDEQDDFMVYHRRNATVDGTEGGPPRTFFSMSSKQVVYSR